MTPAPPGAPDADRALDLEIARLLTIGTYASIALLAVGFVTMILAGRSPFDQAPGFDPGRIPADLIALKPEGFLWLGLLAVIATPSARVAASLVGFASRSDRAMAVVAALILAVIALSVALAVGTES